jgi:2-phospho-L-lactate guanylyltransferase
VLPTALIPVRIGRTAKRRLAHVLGPDERVRLVRTLFEHVASVTSDAGLRVVALTPGNLDPMDGIEVWQDEGSGLNRAVDAAVRRIGAPVLVVHADLPLLGTDDIDQVLASHADVVIARAHDGGTNGLLLRRLMTPAFGPSSASVHARRARSAGLRVHVVDLPGFALDVDDEVGLSACGAAFFPGTRP